MYQLSQFDEVDVMRWDRKTLEDTDTVAAPSDSQAHHTIFDPDVSLFDYIPTESSDLTPPEPNGNHKTPPDVFSPILSLADCVLRTLICPRPTRFPAGVTSPPPTTFPTLPLSRLAPAIFTPGYAQAIAGRAPLVSVIAKFLVQFLDRARDIPTIRSTRETLIGQRKYECQPTGSTSTPPPTMVSDNNLETDAIKAALRRHLWTTMANGMMNPEAARRLKPIKEMAAQTQMASWRDEEEYDEDGDMLDLDCLRELQGEGPDADARGGEGNATHTDMRETDTDEPCLFDLHELDDGGDGFECEEVVMPDGSRGAGQPPDARADEIFDPTGYGRWCASDSRGGRVDDDHDDAVADVDDGSTGDEMLV